MVGRKCQVSVGSLGGGRQENSRSSSPSCCQGRQSCWTDTIPWMQRHTSTDGLEIVSLDKVGAGEDSSLQYYAQVWLPKASVDLYFYSQTQ